MDGRQASAGSAHERIGRSGREAQRRRTRAAIVDATSQLILAGATPSIDEIAVAADVSRRTIYLYFSTLDQLLLDATAGALSTTAVEEALDTDSADPVDRVDVLVQALIRTADETLPLGRRIIALTVDAAASDGPRRGYRRTQWLEKAIAPLRGQITPEQYERLLSGLSIIVGWEAMVILRDIRDLDREREAQTLRWAATALVRAILAE